jgi:hypothetical protein
MHRSLRITLGTLTVVASLAFAAGCHDSGTDPNASVGGSYSLRTINGSSLPYLVLQSGTYKYEIVDDAIVLTDAGTWTEIGHDRTTSNGQVSTDVVSDGGTFTRNGTAITLDSPASGSISGSVSNGTLTLADQGIAAVYVK